MKLLHSTALLAGALALSACDQIPGFSSSNSSTTTTTTNTTTTSAPAMPAVPAAPAPVPVPGGPTASVSGTAQQNFTVVNTTSQTVYTLHVSSVTDQNWGPDILGSSTVIAPGATANVTFPRTEAQCNWDIRAVYQNGQNTDLRNINLCQVGTVTLTED